MINLLITLSIFVKYLLFCQGFMFFLVLISPIFGFEETRIIKIVKNEIEFIISGIRILFNDTILCKYTDLDIPFLLTEGIVFLAALSI